MTRRGREVREKRWKERGIKKGDNKMMRRGREVRKKIDRKRKE